ncbi:MAG: hypothetical protein FJ382_15125, partial [Verrucomicrobia bacterium]|nr:hypothetical protein [Verrucomicrobiota bacterium]
MRHRFWNVRRALGRFTAGRSTASAWLLAIALVSLASTAAAQSAATGTITGRVGNSRLGGYLENARVGLGSGKLDALTDSDGYYFIHDVPAGRHTVRVHYTGADPQAAEALVAAGQTLRLDFDLAATSGKPAADTNVVKLGEFVVSTSRQMEAAALAINEQRYSPNIKTVIAADEFGAVVENDIGEVLKFVPGITMDYNGGDARRVSMDEKVSVPAIVEFRGCAFLLDWRVSPPSRGSPHHLRHRGRRRPRARLELQIHAGRQRRDRHRPL